MLVEIRQFFLSGSPRRGGGGHPPNKFFGEKIKFKIFQTHLVNFQLDLSLYGEILTGGMWPHKYFFNEL